MFVVSSVVGSHAQTSEKKPSSKLMYKISILTSRRTRCTYIGNTNWLILFKKIITVLEEQETQKYIV